jgi:MoaA/NifB/PqqE/SkfB family radical SAM enzyme
MIETTNYCNVRCPLCPTGLGTLQRPKGFMDEKLYYSIIDQFAPQGEDSVTLFL